MIRYLYGFPPLMHDSNCGIYQVQVLGTQLQYRAPILISEDYSFLSYLQLKFIEGFKSRPGHPLSLKCELLHSEVRMDMPPRVRWRENGVEDKIITTGPSCCLECLRLGMLSLTLQVSSADDYGHSF